MAAPKAATAVLRSRNTKTGALAATYAPIQQTCPRACSQHPDNGGTCYAAGGRVALVNARLTKGAAGFTPEKVARVEARAIDGLRARGVVPPLDDGRLRPLRVHVSGDSRTNRSARIVAAACGRYERAGGGQPYTYTHAWRTVRRASWGGVSVLASVELVSEGRAALRRGYAPAVVVGQHHGPRAWDSNGVRWIPCPQQTRDVACVDCNLCMDAAGLRRRKTGIAFAAHGMRAGTLRARLAGAK